jgi:hypothetical protein
MSVIGQVPALPPLASGVPMAHGRDTIHAADALRRLQGVALLRRAARSVESARDEAPPEC